MNGPGALHKAGGGHQLELSDSCAFLRCQSADERPQTTANRINETAEKINRNTWMAKHATHSVMSGDGEGGRRHTFGHEQNRLAWRKLSVSMQHRRCRSSVTLPTLWPATCRIIYLMPRTTLFAL